MTANTTASRKAKKMYTKAKDAEDYLLQRIDVGSLLDCWLWKIGKDKDGYGQSCHKVRGKVYEARAHRLAYATWVGQIPKEFCVCHTCDNPSCCNPHHLFLGTSQDNVTDMMNKGRYVHPSTLRKIGKLSIDDLEKILELKGAATSLQVAKKFGISFSRVCQIWRGEYGSYNNGKS